MPKGLTMTLEDCEAAISAIESGKLRATAEAIEVRAIAIARRCRAATWNIPSFRDKAEELARRAENIVRQLAPVSAARNGTSRAAEVASYPDFLAE